MIYIIFFIASWMFAGLYDKKHNLIYACISILLMSLLAGLRNECIGTDTATYPLVYWDYSVSGYSVFVLFKYHTVEEGFILLCAGVARFTDNFNVFLTVVHLIICSSLFYANKLLGNKFMWSLFIFSLLFFSPSLNAMRQSLAISICYIGFAYMLANKNKKSLFMLVPSYLFHHTSVIFYILIFEKKVREKVTRVISLNLYKVIVVVLLSIVLYCFSYILESMVDYGVDAKYLNRYGSANNYGTNIPISLFALTIFNLYAFYVIKARCVLDNIKENIHLFEIILIISFIFCFAGMISTFTVRIGSYFTWMTCLIFPYIFSRSTQRRGKTLNTLKYQMILFYSFYWVMCTVVANLGDVYPYLFYFE